jgi:hypothetical protein
MVNNCWNNLSLQHDDKSKLEEAFAAAQKGELLRYLLPNGIGRIILDQSDDPKLEGDRSDLTYFFISAWGPPLEEYDAAEAKGFRVDADYRSSEAGFCGIYQTHGKKINYEYGRGEIVPDELSDMVEDTEWWGYGNDGKLNNKTAVKVKCTSKPASWKRDDDDDRLSKLRRFVLAVLQRHENASGAPSIDEEGVK